MVQTARASTATVVPAHLSTPGKVLPARVYGSSVAYLDSPTLPPVRPITTTGALSNGAATRSQQPTATTGNDDSEFHILHPSLDLSDETGELSRLMLSKWSVHSGEQQFASVSLFCEMKLGEAKRMASWVEASNRFFTVACCQLLEKFISRLDTGVNVSSSKARMDAGGVHGASFLQKVFAELTTSIFVPGSGDYRERLPYFIVRSNSRWPHYKDWSAVRTHTFVVVGRDRSTGDSSAAWSRSRRPWRVARRSWRRASGYQTRSTSSRRGGAPTPARACSRTFSADGSARSRRSARSERCVGNSKTCSSVSLVGLLICCLT